MNNNLPCPLCQSINLNEFSHFTSSSAGMFEVKKVQCIECWCEAPLENWNDNELREKCPH